ncbi:Dam family site-specific DNA-(adenine-N6)-methyltransferase [bacterium]|nr:Dam family site-specific DNA-(adenine-N6)-methyltransferase [bacterium]NUN45624.1 Dam family site-specific DNA-(adenine-N6)-methyltransferase [bacterium]
MNNFFPRFIEEVKAPPIKCQGIKTKLIAFIAQNIQWNGNGRWIEPFLGSGAVLFNLKPNRALVSDTNKHIIQFYNDLKSGKLDEKIVRDYLSENGAILSKQGGDFFYELRNRFNESGGSLEFLFLNRSCFNGLMRFNSDGRYNVPFGHKPQRFSKAYITKITNQVAWVRNLIRNKDWEFVTSDYTYALQSTTLEDFIYLDPPYIGRHADYYNTWSENNAVQMAELIKRTNGGYAISMWYENRYRKNNYINTFWKDEIIELFNHFYHIGSSEDLRNEMVEALIIKRGYSAVNKPLKRMEIELNFDLSPLPVIAQA